MMGATLSFYFFRRFLWIVIQFVIGVAVISYIADFTEVTRRFSSVSGYTTLLGLAMSALRVPLIIQTTIPFVVLFSAMSALVVLNRRYELVVARASGVSVWQILAPLCLASGLVGLVTIGLWNPLAAAAMAGSGAIENSIRAGAQTPPAAEVVERPKRARWIKQRTDEGVTLIGAADSFGDGLILVDATFLKLDADDRIAERLDARTAELSEGFWILTGVSRFVRSRSIERIDTLNVKSGLKPQFVGEQFADPETTSIYDLPRKIAAARSFGLNTNGLRTQLHTLLALPFLLVGMTLIAAVVSMRFTRLGQSGTTIVSGILAGFLLYVASVLVEAFGNAGLAPPFAAAWFPVVVAMFLGITFLLHKEDG